MAQKLRTPTATPSAASDRRTFLKSLVLAVPLGRSVGRATAQSTGSYPPGYDTNSVDAERALTQHTRGVTGSTSVRTGLLYVVTANGGATDQSIEVWTDYQRKEQLVDAEAVYVTGQRYAVDGMVYTKKAVSYAETVSYDRTPGDILVERSTGADILEKFLPYLDFELAARTIENGYHRFTYSVTSFDTGSFTIYMRRAKTVRSATGSLTVDERGRIHDFAFELDAWGDDGNPLTVETAVELEGFGRTTVAQPEWVQAEFRAV